MPSVWAALLENVLALSACPLMPAISRDPQVEGPSCIHSANSKGPGSSSEGRSGVCEGMNGGCRSPGLPSLPIPSSPLPSPPLSGWLRDTQAQPNISPPVGPEHGLASSRSPGTSPPPPHPQAGVALSKFVGLCAPNFSKTGAKTQSSRSNCILDGFPKKQLASKYSAVNKHAYFEYCGLCKGSSWRVLTKLCFDYKVDCQTIGKCRGKA